MTKDLKDLKVAIVCDWLTGIGGAERVILQLHRLFPEAPIYTSQYDKTKIDWFLDADVRTTWLQKLPGGLKKFLPVLRALSFKSLNLSQYDLVISSSGAEAKYVKTGPDTIHICYCHSPIQYYWVRYDEYLEHPGFGAMDWLARLGLKALVGPMRKLDYKLARRPDYLVTNSAYTQANIKKYYSRDAKVIYPPVDIDKFTSTKKLKRHGFIIAGRQTPYKRIDLAVQACTKLSLDLKVIGRGPDHDRLTKMAGGTISFLTGLSDYEVATAFQQSEAFIFPGVDDFGIVAVESLAAGTPVIAFNGGGPKSYIEEGKNGLLFDEQTESSLIKAIEKFQKLDFNSDYVARTAKPFSPEEFNSSMLAFIKSVI